MTWKNIGAVIILVLGFIAFKYGFNYIIEEPETASFEESEWKQSSHAGVTFDSPFNLHEVEVEIPFTLENFVVEMKNYSYESKAMAFFVSKAVYNPGIPVDVDGAIDGALYNMEMTEGVSDFSFDVQTIQKNNFECRRATGKFKLSDRDSEFIAELYVKKSILIQILFTNLSYEENRLIRDRIFKSISITL